MLLLAPTARWFLFQLSWGQLRLGTEKARGSLLH